MPAIHTLNLRNSSFVHSLRGGADDVPLADRLYLLIPIDGCGLKIEHGASVSLDPLTIQDFGEDAGWNEDDWKFIAQLDLGHSLPVFDGIAQEQTIVRVF